VPAGDTKTVNPVPITANRRISNTQDLRYALFIYNAKLKDGRPQVRAEVAISQNGQALFSETDEAVKTAGNGQLLKLGQIGLSGVKPGRYTLTVRITDALADKKYQTITRSLDFVVVD
jgi:hypothetical protein